MILDDFSFLRRTTAGQISHHHPSGGMEVRMAPVSINRLPHLSFRMASISISIYILSHIAQIRSLIFLGCGESNANYIACAVFSTEFTKKPDFSGARRE